MQNRHFDVVIVGAGPAGLSAALLLGRSCRRVMVIDSGQPRNAAARQLHGFLGRDGTRPRDLLADGRRELSQYPVQILDDTVIAAASLRQSAEQPFVTAFRVVTAGGHEFLGRKLLFATGVRDQLPELPGLLECYGLSVHHCPYCDGWEHRGQQLIAFAEGAQAAAGLGLALRGWSERITVVTHGEAADQQSISRLQSNGIGLCQQRVRRLIHNGGQLLRLELEGADDLPADALFFNTSHQASCQLPIELGCKCDDADRGQTGRRQTTNVPGLFLAGDADGDVQFVIVAAAEGATAAVTINRQLQDEDRR